MTKINATIFTLFKFRFFSEKKFNFFKKLQIGVNQLNQYLKNSNNRKRFIILLKQKNKKLNVLFQDQGCYNIYNYLGNKIFGIKNNYSYFQHKYAGLIVILKYNRKCQKMSIKLYVFLPQLSKGEEDYNSMRCFAHLQKRCNIASNIV